jgi:hypothetical protein
MISRIWLNVIVAATASAWVNVSSAQGISNATAFDALASYSTEDPKRLRMLAIVENGLESMDLTINQKAAVHEALDAFVAEMVTVNRQLSTARVQPSPSEVAAARKSVRSGLETVLAGVLTSKQRSVWEADKRARSDAITRTKPTTRPSSGATANR